jgi:hypothetical protein
LGIQDASLIGARKQKVSPTKKSFCDSGSWFLSEPAIPLKNVKNKEDLSYTPLQFSLVGGFRKGTAVSTVHSPGKKRETCHGDILDRGRWEQGG